MGVANLGYVILEMQDPAGWAKFAKSVLGFGAAKSFGAKGAKYLRMDNAPFRYMIRKGDADRFVAGGYQMSSKKAAKGESFTPGHGIKSFKTGKMGLGHMVLPAPENKKTIDFYRKVMGFGVSDDLTLPAFAPGMPKQRIYFMHADNPRHHTLGLYNFPNPTGVIHLMAEMNTIDEVGMCMDRVKEAGLHIFASLGRHANDEMISFYFFAPGGIGFEVGYEGKQIKDWSKFKPTKSKIGDLWGHQYDFPVVG